MADIGIASFTDGVAGGAIPPGDLLLGEALMRAGHSAIQVVWSSLDVDWRAFEAVVIRSCWDYHLHPQAFLAWIARLEEMGIAVVNSPAVIRWNLRKRYLAEIEAAGLAIPETVWVDENADCDVGVVCSERGWATAVVKPLISASAHGTSVRRSGVVTGPAMVQEFVEEIQTGGEWSVIYFGGVFSHSVLKTPADGDFRVQKEYGGDAVFSVPSAEVVEFATRAVAQLPAPVAFARVDIVVSERRGPLLMELEVIEPELFLSCSAGAPDLAASAILRHVGNTAQRRA